MATVLGYGYQGKEALLRLIHHHIITVGSRTRPTKTLQIWYILEDLHHASAYPLAHPLTP